MDKEPAQSRAFKRRKRKEFNAAFRAIHKLLIGAAYMPSGQETGFFVGDTYSKMKKAKKELQKWWND